MKVIAATRNVVEKINEQYCVEEITSFERLQSLRFDSEVAVMDCGEMTIGRIFYFGTNYVLIDTKVSSVNIDQNSFERKKGFIYEILA